MNPVCATVFCVTHLFGLSRTLTVPPLSVLLCGFAWTCSHFARTRWGWGAGFSLWRKQTLISKKWSPLFNVSTGPAGSSRVSGAMLTAVGRWWGSTEQTRQSRLSHRSSIGLRSVFHLGCTKPPCWPGWPNNNTRYKITSKLKISGPERIHGVRSESDLDGNGVSFHARLSETFHCGVLPDVWATVVRGCKLTYFKADLHR